MTTQSFFYHLHTNTMKPHSLSKAMAEKVEIEWLCRGCNHPRPAMTSIDVSVEPPGQENGPLSFVYGHGVPLAKRSFIDSFEDEVVGRDLFLGRVFIEGRGQADEWVTVRGRKSLIVRGDKNVSHRKCTECGHHVYFAMGARYLFPSPGSQHELFESDLSGLIVSQRVFDQIDLNRWRGLVVEKLPVLQEPRDNLEWLT